MAHTTYPTNKQLAAARKAARVEKALAGAIKRNANGSTYGVSGRWVKVTVLPATGGGRNKRGLTGAKRGWGGGTAKGAKRAKRQGSHRMGGRPNLVTTRSPA